MKQVDIARDLGISPATLNRIMKTLYDRGYLFRTSERYVVPNFRFTKNVPMSKTYLELLDEIMQDITSTYGVFTEVVVVTGQDLFWHSRSTVPGSTLPIRAKPGFRRPLYELDAMSRLYLARLGWDYIDLQFNVRSFHDNSPALSPYNRDEARALIESHARRDYAWDIEGNRIGLRRFALAVEDLDGQFLHFLTMAEAAEPLADITSRVDTYHRVLVEARKRLIAVMERERFEAEVMTPARSAGQA